MERLCGSMLANDITEKILKQLKGRSQGAITSYDKPFSASDHDAITLNMLLMGKVVAGRVDYAYGDDKKRGSLLLLKTH